LIDSQNGELKTLDALHGRATNATWRRIAESSQQEGIGVQIRRALHAPELAL
jgi:hypothetical protein